MADVGEEYKMTEAERFTFDLSGFLVRPAIITCAHQPTAPPPHPTPGVQRPKATDLCK